MICPYASELGDDEGIPSGVFVADRYCIATQLKPAPASDESAGLDVVLDLIDGVGFLRGVTVREMVGKGQSTRVATARAEVYVRLSEAGWSHGDIAKRFGRDRSTVRKAIDTWLNRQPRRKAVAA